MTTATVACERAGCTGTILDGYCDTCGLAPAKAGSGRTGPGRGAEGRTTASGRISGRVDVSRLTASSRGSGSLSSGTRSSRRSRVGAGIVEIPLTVPELKDAPLKVSSVVMSTQLQDGVRGRSQNPLVRDGVQLVPNVTHVVSRDQKLFFYYEVYEPGQADGGPQLRTSLAFYRGKVKVFETPPVERSTIDVADRKAAVFQFEVPAGSFTPGLYLCQINIIDTASSQFAFPRLAFYVR